MWQFVTCQLSWLVIYLEWPYRWSPSNIYILLQINSVMYKLLNNRCKFLNTNNLKILTYISISGGKKRFFFINYFFIGRLHVESCGVHLTSNQKKQLCGVYVVRVQITLWLPMPYKALQRFLTVAAVLNAKKKKKL